MCRINGVNPQTGAWMPLFASYRIATLPEEVVIHGRLRPDLTENHPLVSAVLEEWDGRWYAAEIDGETDLVLIGRTGDETPLRWKLHLILFLLTLLTTFTAGALLRGVDPLQTEFLRWRDTWIPYPTGLGFRELLAGAPFAVCLLVVLLGHELGHYFAARFHRVRTTLPYFIPFPPYFSVIGTLGAFIRIQSPMVRRTILLDVGVAGPLASFVLAFPMLVIGMALSQPAPGAASQGLPFVILFAGEPIWIGGSLLASSIGLLFHGGALGSVPIVLHPVAFAGWLGLFVTALNLLPLGQLDGGHILFAFAPGAQSRVGSVFLVGLLPLGFLWWGWWLWGAVALVTARRRVSHPALHQESVPLGPGRRAVAWLTILIFFLTFVPVPLSL